MAQDWADRIRDPGLHTIQFIERRLAHTKGEWAGLPFILEPWQRDDIIRPLFGTTDPDTGRRQYKTAYIELARKNGKSELGAASALKLLLADGEPGAEVYSCATDRDQASIVFNVAKGMIERSPSLTKRCKIYRTRVIEVPSTGSVYRVLSADAFSKHGLNCSGVIFDELHAQPHRELWDVMTTSTGARRQPLVVAITTAGFDRESVCYELHDYSNKVLTGVVNDPSFFAYIRSVPETADWKDETNWYLANPGLGVFRNIEEMRDLARRAAETPALENTFRRLYLSQWTNSDIRWLPIDKWDACNREVNRDALKKKVVYAGLDMASTTDIAAFVMLHRDSTTEEISVMSHFWIPEAAIEARTRRDRVPYAAWVRQGFVEATPGDVIDYARVRERIKQYSKEFRISEMAFDRWGAVQLTQELTDDGMLVVPFGQGFASMSPPTKELMNQVLKQKLRHGGNPVLRWMADNLVVQQDAAGNLKPAKDKSTEKIDGMVALIMALDRLTRGNSGESVYETRGLRTF